MTPLEMAKTSARALIKRGLETYYGRESVVTQPKGTVTSAHCHTRLRPAHIDHAVAAVVLHLNLAGGSVGDINLYLLLLAYFLDREMRARINAILKDWRLPLNTKLVI